MDAKDILTVGHVDDDNPWMTQRRAAAKVREIRASLEKDRTRLRQLLQITTRTPQENAELLEIKDHLDAFEWIDDAFQAGGGVGSHRTSLKPVQERCKHCNRRHRHGEGSDNTRGCLRLNHKTYRTQAEWKVRLAELKGEQARRQKEIRQSINITPEEAHTLVEQARRTRSPW